MKTGVCFKRRLVSLFPSFFFLFKKNIHSLTHGAKWEPENKRGDEKEEEEEATEARVIRNGLNGI